MKRSILDQIKEVKRKEIARKKQKLALRLLHRRALRIDSRGRDFVGVFIKVKRGDIGLIAEVKLASPSAGKLGNKKNIGERMKEYEKAGAGAISVVVDKNFFQGSMQMVSQAKQATSLPVLCKDFIIDKFQIYEAKIFGADALLLIAGLLTANQLKKFVVLIKSLGMIPVVEISQKQEIRKAIDSKAQIIAVNARDFSDLSVDVDRACGMLKQIPGEFLKLGFSGVFGRGEVEKYKNAGAKGVLVGTSLMRTKNIAKFIQELKGL